MWVICGFVVVCLGVIDGFDLVAVFTFGFWVLVAVQVVVVLLRVGGFGILLFFWVCCWLCRAGF